METVEMYKEVLKGEKFNDVPDVTMRELRDAINVFKMAHQLPNCFWEEIKHNNISDGFTTLWQLTHRYLDLEYKEVIGVNKPSQKFLKWIYNELVKVKVAKGVTLFEPIP